ncbi:MAG TPA: FAD-binding oxidoreductase [Candidatus Saccharimonadia bacterium]|jgi:FAD/FMN-containing dehydrogenase|nr:FAD-binding oxidoreductase [Candidatus Saccharimonadia bacterium]
MNLKSDLAGLIKGEVDDTPETIETYSHDASLFEVDPQVVTFPKDSADVQALVKYVADHKKANPQLSITARSAGTDMSGGAVNDSVIADFNRYFTKIKEVSSTAAHVEPGVFYRDFEKATFEQGALMPSYPASRELCTVGGMVNNNSGGEKSLEFGKTENFVTELKAVLADGNEVTMKPLTKRELDVKMQLSTFEGEVYRKTFALVDKHYDAIKAAKPHVTKNSTGYNLWDVWDRDKGIFDLTKLIVGAQGTLGFTTDIKFKLVRHRPHSGVLVVFLRDIDRLGEIINVVLKHNPASFESFDDVTLLLSIRFMPYFLKMLGLRAFIKLLIGLIPEGFLLLRGIPKLILMVEFNGETVDEVRDKVRVLDKELFTKRAVYEIEGEEEDPTESKAEKFWIMRRQSFQILRKKVKDKHTAPFIDDLVVNPEHLPDFLPKMRKIIKKYNLFATIAGHMGDGNFHIIPLMKIELESERAKLRPAMEETNNLVLSYHGVLSGEHNDGMIRGPWLERAYGKEVYGYFKDVKNIFDPHGIFNPHKKANADWDYTFSHIRKSF